MSFFRRKEMLLFAFVPVVGVWLYALGQSFGQVGSMMGAVPADASVESPAGLDARSSRSDGESEFADADVARSGSAVPRERPATVAAPASLATAAAPETAATTAPGAPAAAAGPAPAAMPLATGEVIAPVDARPATAGSDGADLVLDEDPRQRFFDPYDYAVALEAHYENQRPLDLSPSAIEAATVGPEAAAAAASATSVNGATGASSATRAAGAGPSRDPRMRHAWDD